MTAGKDLNRIEISGYLVERKGLRYTPAGTPVVEALLQHASQQTESGVVRQVSCEIPLLALGQSSHWLLAVTAGAAILVKGFLSAKSRNSQKLVLHVDTIEFLEGMENGSILQEEG